MSALQRIPMSYEDYLALPEKPKAEWVDGVAIVSAPAVFRHSRSQGRLQVLLATSLTGVEVVPEAGTRLFPTKIRVPDIAVVRSEPVETIITEPPVLLVEVLSPSTRSEDTVRKSSEYAAGGVGQFWVVDPDSRTIDVFANVDGGWESLAHIDAAHPAATITVEEYGVIELDLDVILPA